MIGLVLDTHALVWSLFNDPQLSLTARATIDAAIERGLVAALSAITVVELVYLTERQRLPVQALDRTLEQARDPNNTLTVVAITDAIAETMRQISRADVPDMPDRIIGATALFLSVPLVSRDGKLGLSNVPTVW